MSFVLTGNARQLRFSGEAKIVELPPEEPAPPPALGRPRVRRPAASARAAREPAPSHAFGDVSNGGRRNEPRAEPVSRGRSASVRRKLDALASRWPGAASQRPSAGREPPAQVIDDDDNPTTALPRDPLDPPARIPAKAAGPLAPIPHFRPANAEQTALIASRRDRASASPRGRLPLAVWIAASILAGVISFHAAPAMMARLDASAHNAAR
ncbi:MAG TPA: hypothetical protein VM925_24325 [Labilithrix sp.]|nr:hypothetical protein [Labilithrix sp.]